MKKRLTLLLLTALLIRLLTMPGRNKRRRHESFTPEEAEEPVEFSVGLLTLNNFCSTLIS